MQGVLVDAETILNIFQDGMTAQVFKNTYVLNLF
jgi:hypothetical protein